MVILIIIFFIAIFQVASVFYLPILGVAPNLILISILFLAIFKKKKEALIAAFAAGLILDLFSVFPLGTTSLNLIFIAELINYISRNFLGKPNIIIMAIIGASGALIFEIMQAIESKIFGFPIGPISPVRLIGPIYNAILMVGLYLIFKKLRKIA